MKGRDAARSGGGGGARLVTVDADSADRRLDNFLLTELKGVPRSRVYRMIRSGEVRVNKGRARASTRLSEGDQVRIPPARLPGAGAPATPARKPDWLLGRIIHEDDSLLALDKPAGLAVHGGSGISMGAIELLRHVRPELRFLELVHRLDRDTSGCLLFAKKRSALRALHADFREDRVRKIYLALLEGEWQEGTRTVAAPLLTEQRQNGERFVRTGKDGKPARTRFTPTEIFPTAVLMRVRLYTGRTHQIRAHAAHIGFPVAGDTRYGNGLPGPAGLQRLFLHAAELVVPHPATGDELRLAATLPAELAAVLEQLRGGG